jgi:hypothetical protein
MFSRIPEEYAYPRLNTAALDNLLTDGGEVVTVTRSRPPFTLRKILGTHFCRGWVDPTALVRPEN